jgi:hypothetical protein
MIRYCAGYSPIAIVCWSYGFSVATCRTTRLVSVRGSIREKNRCTASGQQSTVKSQVTGRSP